MACGHHIGTGRPKVFFRTLDLICGNIQIVSHAHAIPPFRHLRRRHRFQGLRRRFRIFCSIMFSNPGRTSAFKDNLGADALLSQDERGVREPRAITSSHSPSISVNIE